ncbi:MAG: epoxyqueuosine reductase [Halanaerobiales bacterium]|nr:epoxyqueuosine reductase [Halanaerobiales bacterium]
MSSITTDLMNEINTTAKKNGAILVGSTKIRRTEPVIIFAFPFLDEWFFNHPFTLTKRLVEEYLTSKNVHNITAKILTKEGYRAKYKTILSLFGDFRPLAVAAGLGEWGRNGLVVNKDYGSGLLFSAIFTNAPLEVSKPLTPQIPATMETHCTSCGQCIEACPANAFADGKFHYYRCLPHALRGCGECLKACKGK